MKIIINDCYGGFGLSSFAIKRYTELQGRDCFFFTHKSIEEYTQYISISIETAAKSHIFFAFDVDITPTVMSNDWYEKHSIDIEQRNDPLLIQVVEELGEKANGIYAKLKIIEIPDDVDWELDEYDGMETIHEKHRSWR